MKFPIFFLLLSIVSAENSASSYKRNEDDNKPGYSFESSYDNNSRSESRNGKVTTGSYRVPLPDGRVQVVNYRADENGYVADVQYEGEAKYPEFNPASSKSTPAYKSEIVPVVTMAEPTYKIPTTPAPAYVEPIVPTTAAPTYYEDRSYPDPEYKDSKQPFPRYQQHYKISTTTPAPKTIAQAYAAPVYLKYKVPAYVSSAYETPTTIAPETYAASTTITSVYVENEEETKYPTEVIPATPIAKTPYTYFARTYDTPVAPAYGIRYVGDVKQYENRIKYPETKVNSSPSYKSTFFIFPKNKVSSLASPVYEKPEVLSAYRSPIYSLPVAPVPLAFRNYYATKASNKVVDQSTDNKEPSYVVPEVPAYSPVYHTPPTTTPAYKALPTAAPVYNDLITTTLAPVNFASSSKAPEYENPTTSAPTYKPTTFFASNKDYISPGYKELSRIFRETSLTAGNKNWDNFFNKAWEFARTKY